jgi:hypothetical protein
VARAGAGHFPSGHGTTGVWAAADEDRQATRPRAKMERMGIPSENKRLFLYILKSTEKPTRRKNPLQNKHYPSIK